MAERESYGLAPKDSGFAQARHFSLPILIWTLLVVASLLYVLRQLDIDSVEIIATQGREVFRLVEATRVWNAEHGGVFVVQNESNPPNPYLDNPERSTATITGKKLTLINPAYMTRQLAEVIDRQAAMRIHLTSLKLVNPGNKADAWETGALRDFERGLLTEKFEIDRSQGTALARYMAPLFIKQPCLTCHQRQGYKLGDVRGGISVYWSAEPVLDAIQTTRDRTLVVHGVVWLLVSGLLVSGMTYRRKVEEALRDSERRFRQLADYDNLTRLPNRRLFLDRLWQTMLASKRTGYYGALMFIDLDNFKPLNDRYGHKVGDLLLMEVAHRISGCVREIDTVARFGGDEFVVMLHELDVDQAAAAAHAAEIAEKIRAAVAETFVLKPPPEGKAESAAIEHRCTSSIGVAIFHDLEAKPEELLKRADLAMYQAKADGRNLIRFFQPSS
ncbi:MAG TPA: diguanylate cyclase [Gallionella sp.]|nr:diguanylate cyclase [Gallionella sp.]